MNLKDIGEFGLITRLTSNSIFNDNNLIIGIGDDTAVLPWNEENYLLAACDTLVEDIHFIKGKSTPFQIGYKSVAVNFSDIAAMGGWPTAILISLGIPPDIKLEEIDQLYSGIKNICQKYGVNIIGGDTVSSPQKFFINVSVLGQVKKEHLHLRSHARKGDFIFVTGPLGDSAAGLELILNEYDFIPHYVEAKLLQKHLLPEPCLEEIKVLNLLPGVHALNDISDGLASEANEIAEASQLGIKLYAHKIPISPEAELLGKLINKDPLDWALAGGEDFQLIGTISPEAKEGLQDIFEKKLNKPLYIIGEVIEEKGVYLDINKKVISLTKKGYNHFSL